MHALEQYERLRRAMALLVDVASSRAGSLDSAASPPVLIRPSYSGGRTLDSGADRARAFSFLADKKYERRATVTPPLEVVETHNHHIVAS